MNKLRKLGLRVSLATVILGGFLWIAGLFSEINHENFQAFGIYLLVASVFFASPYMIITRQKKDTKSRFETFTDFGVSGFYTAALIFVLYNAIPYFNTGKSETTLQLVGQTILVVSFVWTLCLHSWSTLINLTSTVKSTKN